MASPTAGEKINPAEPAPRAAQAAVVQSSIFARAGLLAYVLLIVYASLYPFSGWQNMGVPLQAYLFAGMPRYWTGFDLVTNVLGYIPLGMLVVFALYPHLRRTGAIALAVLLGVLLSGVMEATQTLLPNRVASNLDLLTNSFGALLGAVIGSRISPFVMERSRLRHLRHHWFVPEASRGLIVFALWPLAQIYPQSYLFGNGQALPVLSDWLSNWLNTPVDIGNWLRHGIDLSVRQYWLVEAIVTACGMSSALLALSCMLHERAPRAALLPGLLAAAIAVRSLSSALLFTPAKAFVWLTPGAQAGLLLGTLLLAGALLLSMRAQRRIAITLLLIGLVFVNIASANPYFVATLETWVQGRFLNFNGAAQFLSLLWPASALWFLLHSIHRRKRPAANDDVHA
jgi:VanZ family protein